MRKIFLLGVLAVASVIATQSLFAYDIDRCEEFQGGTPGLYGLCRAFVNAGNENARDRIRGNYMGRREEGDPQTLDEFFDETAGVCPCFTNQDLSSAIDDPLAYRYECVFLGFNGLFEVHQEGTEATAFATFLVEDLGNSYYFCANSVTEDVYLFNNSENAGACIASLEFARTTVLEKSLVDCMPAQ